MKPPMTDRDAGASDDMSTIMEMLEAQRSLLRKFHKGWLPPVGVSEHAMRLMQVENRFLQQQIDFLQQQIMQLCDFPGAAEP